MVCSGMAGMDLRLFERDDDDAKKEKAGQPPADARRAETLPSAPHGGQCCPASGLIHLWRLSLPLPAQPAPPPRHLALVH